MNTEERVLKICEEFADTHPTEAAQSFQVVGHALREAGFPPDKGQPVYGIIPVSRLREAHVLRIVKQDLQMREQVIRTFTTDPKSRPQFGFTGDEEELIISDPWWRAPDSEKRRFSPIAFSRVDLLQGSQVCEINIGPGGEDWHDYIASAAWETPLVRHLRKVVALKWYPLRIRVAETCQRYFRAWAGRRLETVAILGPSSRDREALLYREVFSRIIPRVLIATPADLRWKVQNQKLLHNQSEVDLVFRTSGVTISILAELSNALVEAVLKRLILVIPTLCSRVAGNKVADCFLGEDRHHPWANVVSLSILKQLSEDRERLILKPALGGGGQDGPGGVGIHATFGSEVGQATWEQLLQRAAFSTVRRYVVQEVVPVPRRSFLTLRKGGIAQQLFAHDLGVYTFCRGNGNWDWGWVSRGISLDYDSGKPVKLNVGEGIARVGCVYTVG